jgi:MOSC domain-containing protein YiiM
MAGTWRDHDCVECGFDVGRWTDQDVRTTIGVARPLWDGYVIDLREDLVARRPDADTWSIVEYADHTRDALFGNHFLLDSAVSAPGIDLGAAPTRPMAADVPPLDLARVLDGLDRVARALSRRLGELDDAELDAVARLDGKDHDGRQMARHAAHELIHHLHDVGRIRVALGDGVAPARGHVGQVNVSDGGVPKRPVPRLDIGWSGPSSDRQNDRKNHGRPFQAVCIWSAEVIAALASEGHPIQPGSAGENVTVAGIDWAALRPGVVLRVGETRLETSSFAVPCSKNKGWFADGDWNRILHTRHPGWSRIYATVLSPGAIEVGDVVEVEPG